MNNAAGAKAHYRLDVVRRFAAGLASGVGVAPARASALASQLLWFDAAGASSHGIASLPGWLDRIDRGEIDPVAEGRAHSEHAGTAQFDGQKGLGPLILARAAGIAMEKARDVGIGVVRVANLGHCGPAAPIVAELAVGPYVAAMVGPGPSCAIALPSGEGLPFVSDSALGDKSEPDDLMAMWTPWTSALAGPDGWAILALAVPAFESLSGFHERIEAMTRDSSEGNGRLSPVPWDASRRKNREEGLTLDEDAAAGLRAWADRLGIAWPSPS